jgi:hypothetical protein
MSQKPEPLPCPVCEQPVLVTTEKLLRSPTLTCPQGHLFQVDARRFNRELDRKLRQISSARIRL